MDEVLAHPWFSGVDQNDILSKLIVPPFIPQGKDCYGSTEGLAETYIPKDK